MSSCIMLKLSCVRGHLDVPQHRGAGGLGERWPPGRLPASGDEYPRPDGKRTLKAMCR